MRIAEVKALPMTLTFASIFGGIENVPPKLLTPASHFKRFKRIGQQSTIVRVTTDTGLHGYGEAFGIPSPSVSASAVESVVGPLVVGQTLTDPATIFDEIERYFVNLGHSRGPLMEGLSALDMALWDIAGKAVGKPVAELLGSNVGSIRTYSSPVAFSDDPAEAARSARDYVNQGFRAIKAKVGDNLQRDLDNLEAVRAEVGSDIRILIDANGGFDVQGAIAFAREISHLDIGWFEEPVPANDIEGLRAVRAAVSMPVAWGENEFTVAGVRNAVLRDAIDIVQPNVTRAGGITGGKRIADFAAEHGVAFAPHGVGTGIGITAMLHVCRAASTFDVYEANRLLNPLRDEHVRARAQIQDGSYSLEQLPGLGIDVPWDALVQRFGKSMSPAHA